MVGVAGERGAHLSMPTSLWSILLRHCQVCRNHRGENHCCCQGGHAADFYGALKHFISPLTGAKQKEPETE